MNIKEITLKKLTDYASKERKKINEYFFKTDENGYSEKDIFLGVRVPNIRKVSKEFLDISLKELTEIINSKIHEQRQLGSFILTTKMNNAIKKKDLIKQRKIINFFKKNIQHINNWDLVDWIAPRIIGKAILNNIEETNYLFHLAKSKDLWEKRIAIISTQELIRNNIFDITINISKELLSDSHDLIHKAIGWMLREIWKKDNILIENFLKNNYDFVPRTTLRYAIERMEEKKRKKFLHKTY